jgi:hypothetical protein
LPDPQRNLVRFRERKKDSSSNWRCWHHCVAIRILMSGEIARSVEELNPLPRERERFGKSCTDNRRRIEEISMIKGKELWFNLLRY